MRPSPTPDGSGDEEVVVQPSVSTMPGSSSEEGMSKEGSSVGEEEGFLPVSTDKPPTQTTQQSPATTDPNGSNI